MNASCSILITNYTRKSTEDSPDKTLIEFFSNCGNIQNFVITEDPTKKGDYTAIITFDSPEPAKIALLLNTDALGQKDICVKLLSIEEEKNKKLEGNVATPKEELPQVHSVPTEQQSMFSVLLSKGYKLKDNALDLANQLDGQFRSKVSTVEVTVQENFVSLVAAYHNASGTVLSTGKVAFDATESALKTAGASAHDKTIEATKIASETVGSFVAASTNVFFDATTAVTNTGKVVINKTGETLRNTGEAVATTSKVALDVTTETLKQTGEVVMSTGQVAIEKTSEAFKQAGEAVSTTSQVAFDVSGQALKNASNAAIEATQIAGATIASLITGLGNLTTQPNNNT